MMPMVMNAHMGLSKEGEQYIKVAEAPNGKPYLKAYDDGTGTPTIGWGCTHGIKMGMKITVDQAQAMFDKEIAECVDAVRRLIKRPVSQGLFDALVSFFYNNGWGKCPTLINAVNSGSDSKTRAAFMLYTKAYDKKLKRTVSWPGLVKRRTSELAHWAEMDAKEHGVDPEAWAPAVEPEKPSHVKVALSSKTVWLKLQSVWLLVVGWFTDWGQSAINGISTLFDAAPDIATDASSKVSVAREWAEMLGANIKGITLVIVVLCIVIGLIRHTNDKRELA